MSDTSLGDMFWNAAQQTPVPVAEEPKKASSCCGPKPAAETPAAPKKASSCCGPKPAADTGAAPKKASSCCGPKPAAAKEPEGAAVATPAKSSCCG